jgi:hypothetical protein
MMRKHVGSAPYSIARLDAQLAAPDVRDRLRLLVAAGVVEIRRPAA